MRARSQVGWQGKHGDATPCSTGCHPATVAPPASLPPPPPPPPPTPHPHTHRPHSPCDWQANSHFCVAQRRQQCRRRRNQVAQHDRGAAQQNGDTCVQQDGIQQASKHVAANQSWAFNKQQSMWLPTAHQPTAACHTSCPTDHRSPCQVSGRHSRKHEHASTNDAAQAEECEVPRSQHFGQLLGAAACTVLLDRPAVTCDAGVAASGQVG